MTGWKTGLIAKAHADSGGGARCSLPLRGAILVCLLGAFLAGCLNPQDRTDQSIQKMEALDDTACRQQTASVEEPMRAQAYAECRRLRVAYWQVGTSPNTSQQQSVAASASSCGRATESRRRRGKVRRGVPAR